MQWRYLIITKKGPIHMWLAPLVYKPHAGPQFIADLSMFSQKVVEFIMNRGPAWGFTSQGCRPHVNRPFVWDDEEGPLLKKMAEATTRANIYSDGQMHEHACLLAGSPGSLKCTSSMGLSQRLMVLANVREMRTASGKTLSEQERESLKNTDLGGEHAISWKDLRFPSEDTQRVSEILSTIPWLGFGAPFVPWQRRRTTTTATTTTTTTTTILIRRPLLLLLLLLLLPLPLPLPLPVLIIIMNITGMILVSVIMIVRLLV